MSIRALEHTPHSGGVCVWSKIQWWKEKLLSQAGREVLLKSVVQAIPTFAMSCFKLPHNLCKDIECMICKFW